MVNCGKCREIVINGLKYVNKEDFIRQLEDHIKQCRGDWNEDSEIGRAHV